MENLHLILIIAFLLLGIGILTAALFYLNKVHNRVDKHVDETDDEFKNILIFTPIILFAAVIIYMIARQYGISGHVMEWFNLLVRWTHVIIGIAWIGASFYFVFLENSLNRTKDLRDELVGNLWAVHGGGFYYVEKYKTAPKQLPNKLHWFKYEAYFTWITGIMLLFIVFYFNAKEMLIDNSVMQLEPWQAIGIGIGTLAVGWIVYDLICSSKLVQNGWLFATFGFLFTTGLAYVLTSVLSSRGAYIHVGAFLGTLMAGNVFKAIIPAQKALVAAVKEGKMPDPALGKHAGLRSLHNNYMTLPVVFIMISSHFPSTFGNQYNWAILASLFLASGLFRHYLNLKEKGKEANWIIPISTFIVFTLGYVTSPTYNNSSDDLIENVTFNQVNQVMQLRCITCHSANPSDETWKSAPNGVKFDTKEEILLKKEKIMARVVTTKNMPLGNKTNMTEEERLLVKSWIVQLND